MSKRGNDITMLDMVRRQKYTINGSRTAAFTEKLVQINFTIQTLDIMCAFSLSENKYIKKSHLIHMRNLFSCLDLDIYKTDQEKLRKIKFIKKALEGRITQGLNNTELILQYVNGGILDLDDIGIDITLMTKLSTQELKYVTETVSSALKYTFIYNDIDKLYETITRFKAADYVNKQFIVSEIEGCIIDMQNKFRKVKVDTLSETEFRLNREVMDDSFKDIYDKVTNPNAKLVTGLQGLNEMLGGGFYGTRVYMLLGLTGGGKSLTLLDICTQLKKYNKNFKTKDPTKRPCIVYLTMENTVEETVERLFDMMVGRDIGEFTYEDALNALITEGELCLNDESPIDIIIKYKANKSIDTSYLYTMTEDLEDEGYEVISFVQDHVGRINSTERNPDTRIELGTVVNEFKTFCQLKEIPLITNFHLNRDAATKVDEAYKASKSDLVRVLGRDNVAESQFMINNLDGCFMITQETDANDQRWLGVMRTKKRYKASERNVIFLPYKDGSPKLIEDYYSPVPVFRDSLREQANFKNSAANKPISKNKIAPVPYSGNIENIDSIIGTQNNIIGAEPNVFDTDMSKPAPVIAYGNRADIDPFDIIPPVVKKRTFVTRIKEIV